MAFSTIDSYTEYETTDITEIQNGTNASIKLDIYGGLQLIFLAIGIIGNILILVVLHKSKGHLQPVTSTLVKHQSVIDAMVCITRIGNMIIRIPWVSGVYAVDVFLCHVFHTFGKHVLSYYGQQMCHVYIVY